MRSLRANFIWNASYQVVRIIIPLITMPYLSRVLGSSPLGVYSYTYTIANYFIFFILLGLNQYGVREIAKVRENGEELSKAFNSIFAMQIGSGIIVVAAYLVYIALSESDMQLFAAIWSIWVVSEVFDIAWLFFGLEEFKTITIRNIAVKLFVVIGIFGFVHTQADLWIYCFIQASGSFVSVVVLWPMIRGRVRLSKPIWNDVKQHIKPNLMLFAPVIAISFYTQIDKVLLGSMSTMNQLGFYDNAEKISLIPLSVIQALGTVMLPRMSNLVAAGKTDEVREHIGTSIWFANIMAMGFMFGIAGVSHEFVPVFFGPGFEPVEIMMPLIGVIIPIVAWSNVLGVQFLLPSGKDCEYLISVICGAMVNVVLNFALIPELGGVGSSIATIAAELSVTLMQVYYLRSELPFGRYLRDAVPYVIIGALMMLVTCVIGWAMGANVLGVSCQITGGAVCYAAMAFAWMTVRRDSRIRLFKQHRWK